MKRLLVLAALAAVTATGFAQDPGQSVLEHNGWFRYTNTSTEFGVTDPSVSRFTLERGYVRLSHRWTDALFTKFTVDMFSSDKYADGATVRLKEAFADIALPIPDFLLTAGLQKHYFGAIYSWDYTHPDKSLADAQDIAASADYGLTVNGFLPSGLGELQLGVYNGEGYKYVGKYVNTSPELLANLRLTPFAGLMVGASAMYNAEDMSRYKNDKAGRSSDGTKYLNPDTVNSGILGLAPVFRLAFGPVALNGEYIVYNYARQFSYYGINRDSAGAVIDSALVEKSKKYAQSGFDLMPVATLARRKLEVYGRFSTWERREEHDGTMEVNLDKSLVRYGAGANWHLQRRERGRPGMEFQFAWVREQARKEGSKPKDTFMAQFRFEWSATIPALAL
jgi:hypothetical protein